MTFRFTTVTSVAVPLLQPNIDTDIIIPARFLKRVSAEGLGAVLFHEWRFTPEGAERPEFVLNQPDYRQAQILVADRNFGCGSSRENAVWALYDYGIRCVIAPSFGDIFFNNCINYGLLAVRLDSEPFRQLIRAITEKPEQLVTVSLDQCQIACAGDLQLRFNIDRSARERLRFGLDETSLTIKEYGAEISSYERRRKQQLPWIFKDVPETIS